MNNTVQLPASWAIDKDRAVVSKIMRGCLEIYNAGTKMSRGMSFKVHENLVCSIDPHETAVEFKYYGDECTVSGAIPTLSWTFSYADDTSVLEILLTFISESCMMAIEWIDEHEESESDASSGPSEGDESDESENEASPPRRQASPPRRQASPPRHHASPSVERVPKIVLVPPSARAVDDAMAMLDSSTNVFDVKSIEDAAAARAQLAAEGLRIQKATEAAYAAKLAAAQEAAQAAKV